MQILQVKEYHNSIALNKHIKALQHWREKDNGYSYPVKSFFYFMLENKKGYPMEERQKGYIAFDNNKAVFGFTKEKAIQYFQK